MIKGEEEPSKTLSQEIKKKENLISPHQRIYKKKLLMLAFKLMGFIFPKKVKIQLRFQCKLKPK